MILATPCRWVSGVCGNVSNGKVFQNIRTCFEFKGEIEFWGLCILSFCKNLLHKKTFTAKVDVNLPDMLSSMWAFHPSDPDAKYWSPLISAKRISILITCDSEMPKSAGWIKRKMYNPWSLSWNQKMMVSKRNLLFHRLIFRFHVKLQGCTMPNRI